ncbi:WAT1-related protein [Panicum miliaceum]|uniref:WAT1-related protein n=1 Tax=Panicum miliaceum TaxID=4540 RepID=A0A3L6T5X2_PANMI|nr:WAT1-related protein [Panicum miliaceum]
MAGGRARAAAEGYKPFAAMVATQCIFAAMTLWVKAAFTGGMSPTVFVVYRQAVATLVLAPIAAIANRSMLKEMRLGANGFFLAGKSEYQRSSIAKVLGTAVCVGGAITIAFFKGPKLLNLSLDDSYTLIHSSSSRWVMGALLLIGSSSCWSLWLILQGPICRSYMDPLTLSAWTCFLSTLQSAVVAFFLLPDRSAWKIHSLFELSCYIFAGVFGSGVVFYLQSWCISARGPLYSAMFIPLCTVLTTALSAVILREELHIGRHVPPPNHKLISFKIYERFSNLSRDVI